MVRTLAFMHCFATFYDQYRAVRTKLAPIDPVLGGQPVELLTCKTLNFDQSQTEIW